MQLAECFHILFSVPFQGTRPAPSRQSSLRIVTFFLSWSGRDLRYLRFLKNDPAFHTSIHAVDAKDGTDGKDASQKEPKRRYGPRELKVVMSKRRHMDSVENQDTRAKKAKGKAAPAKKSRPVQLLSFSGQLCDSQQELFV